MISFPAGGFFLGLHPLAVTQGPSGPKGDGRTDRQGKERPAEGRPGGKTAGQKDGRAEGRPGRRTAGWPGGRPAGRLAGRRDEHIFFHLANVIVK